MIGKKDSIKDVLIITALKTATFYALKVANPKSRKASLDAMDVMKLAGETVGAVLVRDYVVYKNGSKSDKITNIFWPSKGQ